MPGERVQCPKCRQYIDKNKNFCPNCGKRQITRKMIFIYFTVALIILFVVFIISMAIIFKNMSSSCDEMYAEHQVQQEEPQEYKLITPMQSEINNISERQALEKIIQQEQYFKNFLSQNFSGEENSKIFSIFYKNLISVCEKIDSVISNYEDPISFDDKKPTDVKGIIFSPNNINMEDYTGFYKITNPQTNLFRTTYSSMTDDLEIDYTYMYNQYSIYLTKPYRDYLYYKMQEQSSRKNCTLWFQEHRNRNVTKDMIINNLLILRKILDKNPNFELWNYVLTDIKIYTDALLFEDWKMEDEPYIKDVLDKFFEVARKGTFEYNAAEKLYDYEVTNGDYETAFREWSDENFSGYKPIISEEEINYYSLKFDKTQLLQAYNEATEYCKAHLEDRDENGNYLNTGSRWLEGCISEQVGAKNATFKQFEDALWNYCSSISISGVEEGTCIISEYERLKQ